MNYDLLAVIPTAGLLLVMFFVTAIKIYFRPQENLRIRKTPLRTTRVKKQLKTQPLAQTSESLRASYSPTKHTFMIIAVVAIYAWLGWQIWTLTTPYISIFKPFYILFGGYTLFQYIVSVIKRPTELNGRQAAAARKIKTAVIVPVYNEDDEGLKKGLRSLMAQSVLPREIHVVDDGSKVDYAKVKRWFKRNAKKTGITATWTKQANSGKRAAQANAFSKIDLTKIDIVVTVDSDGELDEHAIEEGIKPFVADKKVQSVAGVVVAKNAQDNILARITDLLFVSNQQLIDRGAMSTFNSVIVNSGGLALYRTSVIVNALKNDYEDEYFMGRKVTFSDDSYLTLIAIMMGKTVQQPTSIVFSDMPVQINHHVRQQVRWGRGSFIRGWWRIRYLDVSSAGFIRQALGWIVFTTITTVQLLLFVVIPLIYDIPPPLHLLLFPVAFAYLLSLRYFSIRRSDMLIRSQILTYLAAPVAMLWSAVVLRSIRLYAMTTCLKTGWGTRQNVEIIYTAPAQELATSVSS